MNFLILLLPIALLYIAKFYMLRYEYEYLQKLFYIREGKLSEIEEELQLLKSKMSNENTKNNQKRARKTI